MLFSYLLQEEEEEDAPVETKQMLFKVKLVKYDEKQKVSLIKEIKSLLEGMNLVQVSQFIFSPNRYGNSKVRSTVLELEGVLLHF